MIPLFAAALMFAAVSPLAAAAPFTIVDWGGNYVSGHQALQAGGFDSGQPLLLHPTSGYDTTQTSAVFHGRYTTTTEGASQNLFQVQNNSGNDRIEFKRDNNAWAGLVLWLNSNFLNEGAGNAVSFDGDSEVSMTIDTNSSVNYRGIVLQIGSSYYISANMTGNSLSPTEATWYSYDPINAFTFTSANAIEANEADLLSGGLITGVTGIGYYAQRNAGSGANALRVSGFEVTAVPEPGSLALMGLGGLLILARRREA